MRAAKRSNDLDGPRTCASGGWTAGEERCRLGRRHDRRLRDGLTPATEHRAGRRAPVAHRHVLGEEVARRAVAGHMVGACRRRRQGGRDRVGRGRTPRRERAGVGRGADTDDGPTMSGGRGRIAVPVEVQATHTVPGGSNFSGVGPVVVTKRCEGTGRQLDREREQSDPSAVKAGEEHDSCFPFDHDRPIGRYPGHDSRGGRCIQPFGLSRPCDRAGWARRGVRLRCTPRPIDIGRGHRFPRGRDRA